MTDPDADTARFEITGCLDREAAEALQLEIRRLAKLHGVEIEDLRIEETGDEAG